MKLLVLATALGCGIVGGVFFAFSTFIMKALARLPAPQGIAAMQSINIVVINPAFIAALFGTGLLCAVLVFTGGGSEVPYARWAAIAYLVGTIGVTMAGNVPLNDRLAKLDPQAESSAAVWQDYVRVWTRWNHMRTAAALVACVGLMMGMPERLSENWGRQGPFSERSGGGRLEAPLRCRFGSACRHKPHRSESGPAFLRQPLSNSNQRDLVLVEEGIGLIQVRQISDHTAFQCSSRPSSLE
ncbi:DUF1772 domain-containing protein [Luteolibacter sp. Populi]|uniref:anthrone oxygenase family protein n=1 Tax=Luteolibacter sp. Populi TaxID=3230487 RepID=UPI003466303B